jgi:hypothetical protein
VLSGANRRNHPAYDVRGEHSGEVRIDLRSAMAGVRIEVADNVPPFSSANVIAPMLTSSRPGPVAATTNTCGIVCSRARPPRTDWSQCSPE